MKRLGWAVVVSILCLSIAVLYGEHQAREHRRAVQAEIHKLAVSVERLAVNMERMIRAQGQAYVEPIIIVEGDPSIGTPIETTWQSGSNTIVVKVYKETGDETGETQLRRAVVAQQAAAQTYPPN